MKLIPAIDLIGGRCVRLAQGDFGRRTAYDHDPVELAQGYAEQGATLLHLVDLDGARAGRPMQLDLIGRIADACGIPVQCGGGLRTERDLASALEAGASRVVVGSGLILDEDRGQRWLDRFGGEGLVAALDARPSQDRFILAVDGWRQDTDMDLLEALDRWAQRGLRHALVTDIGRDGLMAGPNTALYRELVRRQPNLALQASGGVSETGDLERLAGTGVAGAIVGRALLDGGMDCAQALAAIDRAKAR